MAKPLASPSPTLEHNRDLARLAMAEGFDIAEAATTFGARAVHGTKAELERSASTSLRHYEPKLDGSLTAKLRAALNTIGAKIRPDLSADQAQSWVNALIIALSDLPPHVATKAAERAVHIPFQFPSEVEAKVRELADEHLGRIALAIRRMDAVNKAIMEAINPAAPRLVDNRTPEEREKALPDSEVHDLQRKGGPLCKQVLRLGLTLGYIKQDQLLPPDDPTIPEEDKDNATG